MSKSQSADWQPEFEGQRPDEELLFVFRRHIIAMRKGFYLLLIPLVITAIPPLIWQTNLKLFILPLVGFGIGLLFFFYHFLMWRYTYFLVTSQRIRQVTQKGLFGTDVVEVRLSKIQNISYNVRGLSGELFNFGTIIIQTFVGDLVIHNVESPGKTYNKLQDALSDVIDAQEYNETTEA